MPRILGVDIPANKKLEYSLRYVFGIGPTRAKAVVAESGFDPDRRAGDLNEEEVNKLASIIADKQYVCEGDLRRERTANLKRLSAIRSLRVCATCVDSQSAVSARKLMPAHVRAQSSQFASNRETTS